MSDNYRKLEAWVQGIRKRTDFIPETGLVLGSGLGELARKIQVTAEVPYGELPGFPVSTVAGHEGKFIFGLAGKAPIAVMQGRVHFYEGYSMEDVVAPIRLMGMLGVKKLFLTNAAGGIDTSFRPGDLMLIEDHISVLIPSPLRGENLDELGQRFPDMSQVYDPELRRLVLQAADRLGMELRRGVYVQCRGPQYETPAEIRFLRNMGASAVGMSTVCEAIAARHIGLRVCGISCITNMASGILSQPLDHGEVQRVAGLARERFEKLVLESVSAFHQL